jgi:hypothetical protein
MSENLCGAHQRMTRLAYNTGPGTPFKEPSRRPPQAVLNEFQGAVDRAENLRRMQNGREVVGIVECVRKLISSERQKAEHIINAAAIALAQLPLPR